MSKQVKPTIRLRLYNKSKMTLSRLFRSKTRFFHFLGTTSWDKAYLKVLYIKEKDVFNDGEYFNKKDLIKAYTDFTEADLVRSTYLTSW